MMGKTHISAKLNLIQSCVQQTVLVPAKRFAQHKLSFSKKLVTTHRERRRKREHRRVPESRILNPKSAADGLLRGKPL
jgi:hypothetical protein